MQTYSQLPPGPEPMKPILVALQGYLKRGSVTKSDIKQPTEFLLRSVIYNQVSLINSLGTIWL